MTLNNCHDGGVLKDVLAGIESAIEQVSTDGAYDLLNGSHLGGDNSYNPCSGKSDRASDIDKQQKLKRLLYPALRFDHG
ncbi:hypothetical protein IFO70_32470 [Phormidium tenue FACHB-886]|nr:hypothetical protein [Phormidium tenue FACHB-886]